MNIHISDKQVEKFQLLYKECFGEEISKETAYEEGYNLVNLIKLVFLENTDI